MGWALWPHSPRDMSSCFTGKWEGFCVGVCMHMYQWEHSLKVSICPPIFVYVMHTCTTMPFHDLCGHYLCTGKLSLSRKTLGIPLTVEDVLMQTHRHAHKTALKLMFCLVLLCPPQGSLRCSHSLIELASLGTVIHWISSSLLPWTPLLNAPPWASSLTSCMGWVIHAH